jgi:hypothetical protein
MCWCGDKDGNECEWPAGSKSSKAVFPWVTKWDQDEGGACPTSSIEESHSDTTQHVLWNISFPE